LNAAATPKIGYRERRKGQIEEVTVARSVNVAAGVAVFMPIRLKPGHHSRVGNLPRTIGS
jgi:hypothetical protein